MTTYLRDRAFVLTVHPYREADAWVSLWTERHGKREAFAAGLRKAGARHQGHLQPFAVVEVMVAHGKAIDRIAVARMTAETGRSARTHESWCVLLGSLAAVCDRLTAAHGEEPPLFAFFLECVEASKRFRGTFSPERLRLAWAFALNRLARHLGYGASFVRCARCGGGPALAASFVRKEGGFLCASCEREVLSPAHSSPLSSDEGTLRKAFAFLERAELADVMRLSAPKTVLADLATALEAALALLPTDVWTRYRPLVDREPFGYLPARRKDALLAPTAAGFPSNGRPGGMHA